MNKKQLLSLVGVAIVVMMVVAIASNEWSVKKIPNGQGKATYGLWKACVAGTKVESLNKCVDLPLDHPNFPKDSLYAARVFAILGAILMACALFCLRWNRGKNCQVMCLLLGGLSSIAAAAIWMKDFKNLNGVSYDQGYSFHLNWVAGAGAVLMAVCMFYCKRRMSAKIL